MQSLTCVVGIACFHGCSRPGLANGTLARVEAREGYPHRDTLGLAPVCAVTAPFNTLLTIILPESSHPMKCIHGTPQAREAFSPIPLLFTRFISRCKWFFAFHVARKSRVQVCRHVFFFKPTDPRTRSFASLHYNLSHQGNGI